MLNDLQISEGNDRAERKLFMTISTSREVHRTRTVWYDGKAFPNWDKDALRISTYDSDDHIFFKIFDEADPNVVLSRATLRPLAHLVDKPAFQRISAGLEFKERFVGKMQVDMMYRCSEFTQCPQGNLCLTLDKAVGTMIKANDYKPIMEVIVKN